MTILNQLRLPVTTINKCANVSPLPNTWFLSLLFGKLSNSFYPSIFMQKWKKAREGLISSNRRLLRKNRKGAYLLRWWVRLTYPQKGSHLKRWTIHPRSPRWWRGQLLVRPLPPASYPLILVRGRGRAWRRVLTPSQRNNPSSSAKAQGMHLSSYHPSSRTTTMKTWAIMPLRPWGRWAYSVWYRYVSWSSFLCSILLLSRSNIRFWFF